MQKLGEITSVKGGKRLPKGELLTTDPNSHPYIRTKDIENHVIKFDQLEYVPDAVQKKIARYIVDAGDLVVSIVGTVGSCAIVPAELHRANLTENCAKILLNTEDYTTHFLYYFLRSPQGQKEIFKNTVGSTQLKLPLYGIENIDLPSLTVTNQKAIAHILGALDDKIELNQKMNQTLEDIAKAIFKSWFVDFDPVLAKAEGRPTGLPPDISDLFPDRLVESEIGDIPNGWGVAKLAEICETTDYVANGSFSTLKENVSKVESFSGKEAMMLRFADFNKGWAGDFSFVTHDSYEFLSKSKVFCGDIVICNVGKVGAVFRAPDLGFDMTLGPNGVLCKNFESGIGLKREYFYFCISEKTFQSRVEAISSGSVQTKFNKTDFRNLDVLIPHSELLAVVDPIFDQICQRLDLLFEENRTLSELRDTLLPKLISGELRIPDAEKFLEKAGI